MDTVGPFVRASLDHRTKLARGRWRIALYPDAGEASAVFQGTAAVSRSFDVHRPTTGPDPSADRRARRQIRRYCAANRLVYLWPATYAPTDDGRLDPRRVRADIREFFRRLRRVIGRAFPYLLVIEWHKTGHGQHVQFAVAEYMAHPTVRDVWGHGIVWVSGPRGRTGPDATLAEARRVARYVAKYVAKEAAAAGGLHRYEVAQGFQPRCRVLYAATADGALLAAADEMGGPPTRKWESRSDAEWAGPPAVWASWD